MRDYLSASDFTTTGKGNNMTEDQQKDLLIEWELYGPAEQQAIIDEYLLVCGGVCSKQRFLDFLKDKLEIEGYWKKVGLA